jgi:hypothetical protein
MTLNKISGAANKVQTHNEPKLVRFNPAKYEDLGYGSAADLKGTFGTVPTQAEWRRLGKNTPFMEGEKYNHQLTKFGIPEAVLDAVYRDFTQENGGEEEGVAAFQCDHAVKLYDDNKKLLGYMIQASDGGGVISGNVFVSADGKKCSSPTWAD